MSGTKVLQVRTPVAVDTGTVFQVSATCTVAGTLPDLGLFVRQVVDTLDPKNDVFTRVAAPDDFSTYGLDRELSISDGTFYYRVGTFIAQYASVSTATDAWNELSSRINTLVTDYDTYINAFLTPSDGATTTYPTVDTSTKNALIDAYTSAVAAVSTAETARDTENTACEALRYEYQLLQEALVQAQSDVAALTPIVSAANPLYATFAAVLNDQQTVTTLLAANVAASGASASEKSTMTAQTSILLTDVSTGLTANATLASDVQTPLASFLATLQARAASVQAEVSAKQLEVNDCALTLAQLQGAVDQARIARDNALAAILAVCPDYTP